MHHGQCMHVSAMQFSRSSAFSDALGGDLPAPRGEKWLTYDATRDMHGLCGNHHAHGAERGTTAGIVTTTVYVAQKTMGDFCIVYALPGMGAAAMATSASMVDGGCAVAQCIGGLYQALRGDANYPWPCAIEFG